MEIKTKTIPDQKLAIINYKGPMNDLDILVSKLMGWIDSEEITVESEPFIIYYSPRYAVNEGDAVYDVGIVILDDDADEYDMVRVVDLVSHEVLSGIHVGSNEKIMESYEEMIEFAGKNNYDVIGSPKEVLIKSKFNAEEGEEYITEIQLPIIKM